MNEYILQQDKHYLQTGVVSRLSIIKTMQMKKKIDLK
jgi:hypothetical protein